MKLNTEYVQSTCNECLETFDTWEILQTKRKRKNRVYFSLRTKSRIFLFLLPKLMKRIFDSRSVDRPGSEKRCYRHREEAVRNRSRIAGASGEFNVGVCTMSAYRGRSRDSRRNEKLTDASLWPSCTHGALPSDLDRIAYTHTALLYVTLSLFHFARLFSFSFSLFPPVREISFPMLDRTTSLGNGSFPTEIYCFLLRFIFIFRSVESTFFFWLVDEYLHPSDYLRKLDDVS